MRLLIIMGTRPEAIKFAPLIKQLEKDVFISLDPDAHVTDGLDDTLYGVLVAQKAMLTKEKNLSSFSLTEIETYLANRKKLKKI